LFLSWCWILHIKHHKLLYRFPDLSPCCHEMETHFSLPIIVVCAIKVWWLADEGKTPMDTAMKVKDKVSPFLCLQNNIRICCYLMLLRSIYLRT
jgi:hypothetical protein